MTESIITQKVLKLLAKAESTTPEEAEALVEKAQELMQRHAITEAALAQARGEKGKPEQIIKRVFHFEGIYAKAHVSLVHNIARACGMRSVQMTARPENGKSGRVALDVDLIGFESDVANGEMLVASLLLQGTVAVNTFAKAWKADNPWANGSHTARERVSFTHGYADGIGQKLKAARKRMETEVTAERGTSVALALVDRKVMVDGWVDSQYGRLTKVRSSGVRLGSYHRGTAAGQSADTGGTGIQGSRGALNA